MIIMLSHPAMEQFFITLHHHYEKNIHIRLPNRHPSPLDQSNEEGYAVEVNYNFSDETSVVANYGITQTLPTSSYYQRVNNFSLPILTQLKEVYLQATHTWNESFTTIAALVTTKSCHPTQKTLPQFLKINFTLMTSTQ